MPAPARARRRGAARPGCPAGEAGHRPRVVPDDARRRAHRLQPDQQPGADRRLRRAHGRDDPAPAQGPAAGARGVGGLADGAPSSTTSCSSERAGLAGDERALVTVLLLRGAQAPGELRTRTERLHAFADREAVEACLARLAARPEPLVRELPRQRGHHDARWVHLLGPVPTDDLTPAAVPAVDRDTVLADGAEARDARVRASYDAVAPAYADHLVDELVGKQPFETLAARPGGRARRRWPGRRGRLRSGPRHGLPGRCRSRRVRPRSVAGHGRRGTLTVPGRQLRGG